MKKIIFTVLLALATLFITFSCEEVPLEKAATEESALKSAQEVLGDPQMTHHPTYTMYQSTVDWLTSTLPPYYYGTSWFEHSGSGTYYSGAKINFHGGYGSSKNLRSKGSYSTRNSSLFRIAPNLDPVGYDGHVAFMLKGPAGEIGTIRTVICTTGDTHIIPDNDEEVDPDWEWRYQEGVYVWQTSQPQFVSLTGDWQYVQVDVASQWWLVYGQNPGAGFDRFPPYDDDVYVWLNLNDNNDDSFWVDFIVNGETTVPTPVGDHEITGPSTVTTGENNTFSFVGEMDYNSYQWSVPAGRATVMSGGTTKNAVIRFNDPGYTELNVRGKFNQMGWSAWETVLVNASDPTPPQPPAAPTISGASTLYGSKPIISSYSQPSGKQSYEWNLPYGTYSVQQYNNIKVIGFSSSGYRTIQGRYKEGGVWSSWGYKSVTVY
jgi:hypothetical protein